MPEPVATTGTILTALATLVGAVFGRARIESRPFIPVNRLAFDHALPMPIATMRVETASTPIRVASPPQSLRNASLEVEHDARRPAPIPRRRDKIVTPEKAVDHLVAFMNAEGSTGLFGAREIDDWWKYCCDELELAYFDCQILREALDIRGLKIGERRLNMPEFLHVKQRTRKNRLTLYRIPRLRAVAKATPVEETASPELRSADAVEPPSDRRGFPGVTPATRENARENGDLSERQTDRSISANGSSKSTASVGPESARDRPFRMPTYAKVADEVRRVA